MRYTMEEDDVLTTQEEEKINHLRESSSHQMLSRVTASIAVGALSLEPAKFTFERRLGLKPVVTINNISGKKCVGDSGAGTYSKCGWYRNR